jgi:hypothetical protein
MISTQKILLMFIILNLILGISMQLYSGNSSQDMIEGYVTSNEAVGDYVGSSSYQKSGTDASSFSLDSTFGNQKGNGEVIWTVLKGGFNPISITPGMFTDPLEKQIAWGVMILRVIFSAVLTLELFMLLFNKKTT